MNIKEWSQSIAEALSCFLNPGRIEKIFLPQQEEAYYFLLEVLYLNANNTHASFIIIWRENGINFLKEIETDEFPCVSEYTVSIICQKVLIDFRHFYRGYDGNPDSEERYFKYFLRENPDPTCDII